MKRKFDGFDDREVKRLKLNMKRKREDFDEFLPVKRFKTDKDHYIGLLEEETAKLNRKLDELLEENEQLKKISLYLYNENDQLKIQLEFVKSGAMSVPNYVY